MMSEKILIFHIGSLGDTLVAVPALWAVRENFPDAHITMLTDEHPGRALVQARDILDGSGLIDDYIIYPVGRWLVVARLLLQLRMRKFDRAVYLIAIDSNTRRVRRDKLFFQLVGIRRCIGMQATCKPFAKESGIPLAAEPHMADNLLARLRTDGLRTPSAGQGRVDVNIGKREQDNVEKWLLGLPDDGGRRWLAIGLGSKMPCKIWPVERYQAVVKYLIDECDLWPVIFGGPGERGLGEKFVQELGCGYVAAGELGVRGTMATMQRCLLYLGNDTGTMHLAVASGVRCVALFTSRDVRGRWYPYGEGHIVLRTDISCEGCMLEECVEQKMKCIFSISVEQVLCACKTVLESGHRRGCERLKVDRGKRI